MSVATELTRIQTAKADIKASIEAKGVTVPSDALINEYADYVDEIQTGGGGGQAEEDLKNLIERDFTTFNIPDGTTKIGDYTFYYKRDLTNVTIPNSVTSIGYGAFWNCEGLASIEIPNSVTKIGQSVFSGCKSLRRINSTIDGEAILPESLIYISYNIFENANLIKMVYLPYNGIVGSNYSNKLFETNYQNFIVYVPQEQYDGYWQKYYDNRGFILPYPRVESTSHTIQYTINSTGSKQVSVIRSEALKFVEKITINGTEVENPKNSTQQLVDGENIIKVWLYDSRIINIKLLYNISVNSADIPDSVTSIGNNAFGYCEALTNVTIPNSVTSIDYGAFYQCRGLTSITIPDSVTSIGGNAFYNCTGLTSITIPNSVTSIGGSAFNSCRGLTSITVQATTPPTLDSNAFQNTNNCPIYVPAESLEAYKTTTNWKTYASRIKPLS